MKKQTEKLKLESKSDKFENELNEALSDPYAFFSSLDKKFNSDELGSLLGYFLVNSSRPDIIKMTLSAVNEYKFKENINDLIDFLMSKAKNTEADINEIINLKITCIKILSDFKDTKCIPALLYCLNDKSANYKMRLHAAEALGKIGDKNAVESLINVLSDEDEKSVYVRESAAHALGMIGDMRAIDPFITILEAKKNFVNKFTFLKERVMEAILKINFTSSKRAIKAFKNALCDDSAQVRINAIECLMNSDCSDAYALIKEKIFDKDEEVVQNAVIALYNIKGKEALLEILKDKKAPNAAIEEANKIIKEYEEE